MRTAVWLYLFSFIAIFDLHAQYPILTPFAVSLGAAPSFIGLMMGLYSITHLPGNLIAGWSVDRYGSRLFIVFSLMAAGGILLLQSRVTDPWQLLVLRSISGFVLAFLSPACMALLARITADRVMQGKLMAGNGLVHTLASVVSPAAGALLVARFGFEMSFFALGWLLIGTAVCALLFIHDIPPAAPSAGSGSSGMAASGLPGGAAVPGGKPAASPGIYGSAAEPGGKPASVGTGGLPGEPAGGPPIGRGPSGARMSVFGVSAVAAFVQLSLHPEPGAPFLLMFLLSVAMQAALTGWGISVHHRRQLLASLRDRAMHAESEARLRAEQAQHQVRESMAREIHDVLGHRLSMLSVHAGALEFRPDASTDDVRRSAKVIRESAHQALQDLREVIGVLRAPVGELPQPTLADLRLLVEEADDVGTHVELVENHEGPVPERIHVFDC